MEQLAPQFAIQIDGELWLAVPYRALNDKAAESLPAPQGAVIKHDGGEEKFVIGYDGEESVHPQDFADYADQLEEPWGFALKVWAGTTAAIASEYPKELALALAPASQALEMFGVTEIPDTIEDLDDWDETP